MQSVYMIAWLAMVSFQIENLKALFGVSGISWFLAYHGEKYKNEESLLFLILYRAVDPISSPYNINKMYNTWNIDQGDV